ncbi:MAG: PKD domain-containing protein [Chitinophagales bacterium]|nr:PKD domain-containing protein [Chitinophagales bacterium]
MGRSLKKLCLWLMFFIGIQNYVAAQGDECQLGYNLTDVNDYCSAPGQFTNTGATTSGFGKPGCWAINNNDVWFKFTAIASDVTIQINGDIFGNGTMKTPEIALYSGNCSGTINELACATSQPNQHFVSLYKGGLIPFTTYYIRVNSRTVANGGTFQLCINNYLPTPAAQSDCITGPFLCTNSTATFQFKAGSGSVPDEANLSCLDDNNGPQNSETASSWMKFTCSKSGKFTFTITPTALGDDLDFAMFELPNGPNSCTPKTLLRCNASACLNRGGLLGLDLTSTDTNEDPSVGNDCVYSTPNASKKNGWLKYVDLVAGKTYGILVNNFTSSGNGFSISFNPPGAGMAEIDALKADFTYAQVGGSCSNVFQFTDASTNGGNYSWNFGPNATPSTASGVGPHTVTYNTPGTYPAILNIGNGACADFIAYTITVPNNNISVSISANKTNFCTGDNAVLTAPTGFTSYKWYRNGTLIGGAATNTYTATLAGTYYVEVSNGTCTGNSNSIVLTVNPNLPVSVSIAASSNPICAGANVTFTATPTNGGTTPAYQWYLNNNPVGSNAATYSNNSLTNGDKIKVTLTSNATCPTGNPATSNVVTMTVNPTGAASVTIAASANPICPGNPVTFTATPVNGGSAPTYQWKKNGVNVGSNSATYSPATINNGDQIQVVMTSNSACVTGSPATSNTITMTVTASVAVSNSIAVNSNPICAGTNVTFTATPGNGGASPTFQWYLNNNPVGTNSTTYSITPANGDKIKCQLTSSSGCATGNPAMSNIITMTVNANNAVSVSVAANNNPICSGTNVTFTATPTNGGATPQYQWYLNGNPVGSNSATYSNASLANGDQVKCDLTSNATCPTGNPATSNTVTMTVTPSVTASVLINASANNICSGTSVTFTPTPINGGSTPSYKWFKNGVQVATTTTYTTTTLANNDQVYCEMTSNAACVSGSPASSNILTMTVNPINPVSVTANVSSNKICAGDPVSFSAIPTNEGTNPVYQWYLNNNPVGTNTQTYIPAAALNNNDQVKVTLTSDIGCPSGNPATSNVITMTVNTVNAVVLNIAPSANPICAGTSVTFSATPANAAFSPVYQWKLNGANVGTNANTYTNTAFANGDIVSCVLTLTGSCLTNNPATSSNVVMTVNPALPVSVSIAASTNSICSGTNVTFTATPTNGGSTPVYQWKKNGVNVGANASTYSSSTLANGDQITCVLTSNATCATGSPATSNTITMSVSSPQTVSVSINASSNPICQGSNVAFTANPTNGGATPVYQWYLNNNPVGTNSATFNASSLANNDQIKVELTSSLGCTTGNPATSNTITMTVNPKLPLGNSISTATPVICQGDPVTFTATPSNGGATPSYQWFINGNPVGTNSNTYSSSTLNDNDVITCTMTTSLTCVASPSIGSNQITMDVFANQPVSVSISTANNPICVGANVLFTATPVNGGSSPTYQWKLNGVNIGANSPTFSSTGLNNGDKITCVLTSNLICKSGNPATSNQVTMVVNPNLPVSITIAADNNTICAGTNVTFTANAINGGASPTYQWKLNGANVGVNSNSYSNNTLNNGDVIFCRVTSNATCPTGNPASSNVIPMTVNPNLPVSVSIVASSNIICSGTNVTFTATPTNGGATPTYQWKLNGVNVGTNSATYSNNTLTNGDRVTCVLTSSENCKTGSPATSNQIIMTVNPNLPVSISINSSANPICAGTNVTFTATPTNGGTVPVYQWKLNGVNVGSNATTYANNTLVNGDKITCTLTSNAVCPTGNPANSNQITMTVNPVLPVSVSINSSSNPICAGTNVTFTATPTNGGTTPAYQWKLNGANVGTNATTYSNNTLTNGDKITCVLTSDAICPSGNPATSNQVVMTVNPIKPVSVSIAANTSTICAGTNVTFTATPVNGGITPTFQWKINGVNVGTNSNTYSSAALANNDVITCVLTSSETCKSGSPATSNAITMTVNPNLPVSVGIAANANPICQNTNVTFTASPVNGGLNPSYQWKLNGVNVGTNSASYSNNTLANNDKITCTLTSNATCPTGNPAISNEITMAVNPNLPVSVSIVASQNVLCQGTNITFTASPVNQGSAPTYQWYLNNNPVGTNAATYSNNTLNNGDRIKCTLTSNATCPTGNPATSNTIIMTVDPILPVDVSIVASSNPICIGTNVVFTATPTNGGTAPVYQWKLNGVNVGSNAATYANNALANGDIITCTLTSNVKCPSGSPATSNAINMVVNSALPVSINVSPSANPICAGTSVTFTANTVNGGTVPIYQWKLNGANVGSNNATYTNASFQNGDQVSCVLTSDLGCATGNPATAPTVTMTVNPIPSSVITPSGPTYVCQGSSVGLSATAGMDNYQWYLNGNIISGAITSTYTASATGAYTVAVGKNNCPGTSNTINVTIKPIPTVNIVAVNTNICPTEQVNISATAGMTHYQWVKDGVDISGANSGTYVGNGGGDYVVNVDLNGCPATSNAITITERDVLIPNFEFVNISPCDGRSWQFTNLTQPTSSLGTTFVWEFGDGSTIDAVSPSHSYASFGTVNVKLTANNFNTCPVTKSITLPLEIKDLSGAITANFNYTAGKICIGQLVNFTDLSTNGQTYNWDFGDGTTSSDQNPTHSYATEGTYSIKLIVANSCNKKDSIVKSITVLNEVKAIASYTGSGCAPVEIQFNSQSQHASTLLWTLPGGITHSESSFSEYFDNGGVFQVKLVASNPNTCNVQDDTILNIVIGTSPAPNFTASPNPVLRANEVVLDNLSKPTNTFVWNFGDGTTSTNFDETHTYTVAGNYNICLTETETSSGCINTVCTVIQVDDKPVVFVPTAFSPNGDGNNDVFMVLGEEIATINLEIFNRWGEKVFSSTEQTIGWDGTFKGKLQNVDTYIYNVSGTTIYGSKFETKGMVVLMQ